MRRREGASEQMRSASLAHAAPIGWRSRWSAQVSALAACCRAGSHIRPAAAGWKVEQMGAHEWQVAAADLSRRLLSNGRHYVGHWLLAAACEPL